MNTTKLKIFAQETRRKLLKQGNGNLEHMLTAETRELRGKTSIIQEIKKDLDCMGCEALADMMDSLEPIGIHLTYEFDESLHDRSITLNNGWKIVLGRGLDIFQKTNGWFDIADHYQEVRKCKGCEITYLKDG